MVKRNRRKLIGVGNAPHDKDEYQDLLAAHNDAIEDGTSGFRERVVANRTNVINLSGTYPVSETRDTFENVEDGVGESRLYVENDNENSFLRTTERARYIPGYEAQAGLGVRIPEMPTDGTTYRWGYYDNPTIDDEQINSGFYFGIDEDGLFVAEDADSEEIDFRKVYQDNWNRDTLTGDGGIDNPSGLELNPEDGYVYQIEFIYYGYGATNFDVWMFNDSKLEYEKVTVHTFRFPGRPSLDNINLPIRAEISTNGEIEQNHEMFVGGRQFSVIGEYEPVTRTISHRRDSRSGIGSGSWHSVTSIRPKDGLENITLRFSDINTIPDDDGYIQVRKDTDVPSDATWMTPSDTNSTETAVEVTESNDVPLSGEKVYEQTVTSGQGNRANLVDIDDVDIPIGDDEALTVYYRSLSGTGNWQGNILKWTEEW